jgi:Glycosyl transferase family 21
MRLRKLVGRIERRECGSGPFAALHDILARSARKRRRATGAISLSRGRTNNVLKGWRAARHDWIVIADSNVLMPRDYIDRLFASWRADTGLVASPPIGCRPQGLWAELECAFLNTYQARWQYLADALGFGFARGKTMRASDCCSPFRRRRAA